MDKEVFHQAEVFNYLFKNQDRMKELVKNYTEQKAELLKTEDKVFHNDINQQYEDVTRKIIMIDVAQHISCGADIILEIVEALNIGSYLNEG